MIFDLRFGIYDWGLGIWDLRNTIYDLGIWGFGDFGILGFWEINLLLMEEGYQGESENLMIYTNIGVNQKNTLNLNA